MVKIYYLKWRKKATIEAEYEIYTNALLLIYNISKKIINKVIERRGTVKFKKYLLRWGSNPFYLLIYIAPLFFLLIFNDREGHRQNGFSWVSPVR